MAEELGHIERPSVESFGENRKIFVVPLILRSGDAPADYTEKFELYWQQVKEQLIRLEEKTGPVECIYHEAIVAGGEEGLKMLEKMNTYSCPIVKERCERGARLEATDDRELAEESMDWERMLLGGFLSEKVARTVSQFYIEASRKRYEHMAKRIDESLKPGEKGVLFITEGHSLQFPGDIQVFSVFPPALDQIHKWFRDAPKAGTGRE
ncbi:MAG: hypothetical protein QUS33_14485 [Dehalococcoidia bacterium]|nr:hypothetical protein [Dehalococcoidia bacterium]